MSNMLDISKQLFGNGSNGYNAADMGGAEGAKVSMRYGTAQSDVANDELLVLLDGATEPVTVKCYESVKQGTRVTVYNSDGVLKAVCIGNGTIGGNLVNVDTVMTNKLFANDGFIRNFTAETISATTGNFGDIYSEAIRTGSLDAEVVASDLTKTKKLEAGVAEIAQAEIGHAVIKQEQVEDLSADYAKIDRTNINEAWVKDLMVQGKFVAQDGTLYKLTGLHIDANDITTGVLTVDRLQLLGSDGLYYALNINAMGKTEIEKLPADVQKECQSSCTQIRWLPTPSRPTTSRPTISWELAAGLTSLLAPSSIQTRQAETTSCGTARS